MNGSRIIRGVVLVLLVVLALYIPSVTADGQILVAAAVWALSLYEGLRPRAVYSPVVLLFFVETIYGGDVGVLLLPYCLLVPMVIGLRRIIALHAWAGRDGWEVSDGIRAVGSATLMTAVYLALAVVVGDMLYGYGHVTERVRFMLSWRHLLEVAMTSAVTVVVWRRASVPFRREIRFGI